MISFESSGNIISAIKGHMESVFIVYKFTKCLIFLNILVQIQTALQLHEVSEYLRLSLFVLKV